MVNFFSTEGLKQVLIVGVYLLSFVSVPCSLSAPTRFHMADRTKIQPMWINPCGNNGSVSAHEVHMEIPKVSYKELLNQIFEEANTALKQAEQFKEEYAQATFQYSSKKLHETFKEHSYDWLPTQNQIPKSLGEPIPQGHFDDLKVETALLDIYENLQKVAVGLEQVLWDQEDNDGRFTEHFRQSNYKMRNLLCEVKTAIDEYLLTIRPDITRAIMDEDVRKMNYTNRNIRDWVIFRDYMNILQYVKAAFDPLHSTLGRDSG